MPLLLALALAAAPADDPNAPAAAKLAMDCSAHQFETTITVVRNGKPAQSKVKLCGTPGQSDAAWIGTLKDAIAKVSTNPQMPAAAKEQIISAVNLEIVRLGAPSVSSAVEASAPPPVPTEQTPLPPPRRAATAGEPVYSALPPFPPPPAATIAEGPSPAASGAVAAAAPFVAPLPRPRLAFTCVGAGSIGEGPCFDIDRDTRITVRAGEALSDTILRFVRRDQERADYPLPPLRAGRSATFQIPQDVCAHSGGGKLTIRIVRAPGGKPNLAQVVGTEGPFNLRC